MLVVVIFLEIEECNVGVSGCWSVCRIFERVDCIFLEGCV